MKFSLFEKLCRKINTGPVPYEPINNKYSSSTLSIIWLIIIYLTIYIILLIILKKAEKRGVEKL